jgi:regulator of sigma E protease
VVNLDGKEDPYYEDLLTKVALSRKGQEIEFRFRAVSDDPTLIPPAPDGPIILVPHRDENNKAPAIGVLSSERLKLAPAKVKTETSRPTAYFSAAAAARSLELKDGDVPVASTDPDRDGEVTPLLPKEDKKAAKAAAAVGAALGGPFAKVPAVLPAGPDPWMVLCERLRKAEEDSEFVVKVVGKDGERREVKAGPGFDFGDSILATTDPATPDRPFNLKDFPYDQPDKEVAAAFDYRRRMRELAGKPVVVRVKRDRSSSESGVADVLVPPAYHVTFGMRMKMGKVVAVREGSPADRAEKPVKPDDVIKVAKGDWIWLSYDGGPWEPLSGPIDPVRLPGALYAHVHKDSSRDPNKWRVKMTVHRLEEHDPLRETVVGPMDWDDSRKPGDEAPLNPASPLSIPQLGLAYRIASMVDHVADGSPAEKAGIKAGDEIRSIRFRIAGKTPREKDATWGKWQEIKNREVNSGDEYDQWANVFYRLQHYSDFKVVEVEVYREGKKLDAMRLEAEPDKSWPMASRGMLFTADTRKQTTSNVFTAIAMGLNKTWRMTVDIYTALTRLVSGRISRENMGGPVAIAGGVFNAAQDPSAFLLILAMISINLAVVNFLPIPILDGGHMVFLIYEAVRGKPPPESVRVFATYLGLAIILMLMIFVFYNDLERLGLFEWTRIFRK